MRESKSCVPDGSNISAAAAGAAAAAPEVATAADGNSNINRATEPSWRPHFYTIQGLQTTAGVLGEKCMQRENYTQDIETRGSSNSDQSASEFRDPNYGGVREV